MTPASPSAPQPWWEELLQLLRWAGEHTSAQDLNSQSADWTDGRSDGRTGRGSGEEALESQTHYDTLTHTNTLTLNHQLEAQWQSKNTTLYTTQRSPSVFAQENKNHSEARKQTRPLWPRPPRLLCWPDVEASCLTRHIRTKHFQTYAFHLLFSVHIHDDDDGDFEHLLIFCFDFIILVSAWNCWGEFKTTNRNWRWIYVPSYTSHWWCHECGAYWRLLLLFFTLFWLVFV